jgi:phosphoadenosine phosphosulfate reductase
MSKSATPVRPVRPVRAAGAAPAPAELEELSAHLEALPIREGAQEAIEWTVERFGDRAVAASSFQDVVLVDFVRKASPGLEIVFLDTGYHFPETLAFVERIRKVWDLNLTVTRPEVGPDELACGTPGCCQARKVEPLQKAIAGRRAWITGLKRIDTPERAEAPVVAWDPVREMVKVNPLAMWSDDDVGAYLAEHDLPLHPLTFVGYVSIGCAPTTHPVAEGHHPREGRWPGQDKTECGLHL